MTIILGRTSRQWLLLGAVMLLEFSVLIALLLLVPGVVEGINSWLMWSAVIAINVLFARQYFHPQERPSG